ncbi:hypothetical protein [Luteimonas sp. e5]
MRLAPVIALACLAPIAHAQSTPPAPVPDAISPGSMTNEKLRQDALVGALSTANARGCRDASNFAVWVTRLPEGTPGERSWQEVWVMQCANGSFPVRIDFREDGLQSAY